MAGRWRPCDMVNKLADVALRPRGRLAVRRSTGHSVPEHALDGCLSQPGREYSQSTLAGPRPSSDSLILEDLLMTDAVKVGFVPFSAVPRGILVVFCDETLQFGPATAKVLGAAVSLVSRAAETNQFKGKSGAALDILAPEGLKAKRLIVMGLGKLAEIKDNDFLKLGGSAAGTLRAGKDAVTIVAELATGAMKPDQAAAIASGLRLRAYKFDRYKTKKEGEEGALRADVSIAVGDVAAARKAFAPSAHIVEGVITARDLVNEPPNVLFPVEFARRASQLRELGVGVDVLDVNAMKRLGMGALLGVAQGSTQPGRTVIMRWNGGKKGDQPVAFIGK